MPRQAWSLVSITMAAMLVSTLFLTRFALTLGERELSLPLVVVLLGMVFLIVTGAVQVSQTRVLLFCTAMAAMLIATVLGGSVRVSWASYLNVVLVYACYLAVAPDDREFARALALFRTLMLVVAIAGILQFFGQLVVKGPTLFTFVGIFPTQIISHGFNYVIPVPGLGGLNKSNGFFLVEPSSLSQLAALAIIVELEFFKPSWRLGVFGLALMLSFSGTGLLLFAAIVPLYLLRRGWGGVLLLAGPAALFAAIVLAGPKLALLLDRLSEFGSDQSSGFARFLSPFYLFEYGLLGALPFAIFVGHCFFAGTRSIWLSTALFLNYLILGGNLVDARLQVLILVLVVLQNRPADIRHARAAAGDGGREPPWPDAPAADNGARTETRSPALSRWP